MFRLVALGCLVLLSLPAHALGDPTRPGGYSAEQRIPDLRLESVLVGENRRVAVINGLAVSEGDRVAGARVLHIGKQRVRIERAGKIIELALPGIEVRREKK